MHEVGRGIFVLFFTLAAFMSYVLVSLLNCSLFGCPRFWRQRWDWLWPIWTSFWGWLVAVQWSRTWRTTWACWPSASIMFYQAPIMACISLQFASVAQTASLLQHGCLLLLNTVLLQLKVFLSGLYKLRIGISCGACVIFNVGTQDWVMYLGWF